MDPTQLTYSESNKAKNDTVGGAFPEPDLHLHLPVMRVAHGRLCSSNQQRV